ncbi:MAG: tetratricopeptide repeat protein [Sphingobacteriales bacterium JAD_PAG50586_3]|nr:MAG: tetratricopeptide repeat protein [Sphingobacteriales bacterium JAD_PAG50586_3]
MRMKGLWLMFMAVCFCLQVGAQNSDSMYVRKAFEKARKDDFTGAIELYQKALKINPTNYPTYTYISTCYFSLGERGKAEDNIKGLLNKHPNEWAAHKAACKYYVLTKQFYEALDLAESAVKKFANEHDTVRINLLCNLGNRRQDMMDYTGGKNSYMIAHAIDSSNTDVWYCLAGIFGDLGKPDSSIYYYRKIIQKKPDDILHCNNLGYLYNTLGRFDEAIQLYDKAILEVDKNKSLIGIKYSLYTIGLLHSNHGYALYKKGNYKKALKEFQESIEYYPTNSYVYRNRALLYVEQKKYDEACKDLNFAIALGFADQYGPEVDELIAKHCQ